MNITARIRRIEKTNDVLLRHLKLECLKAECARRRLNDLAAYGKRIQYIENSIDKLALACRMAEVGAHRKKRQP